MAVGTRLISSLQGMGALFRLNLVHIGHDQCRTAKMPSLRAGGLCHRTKPPIHPRHYPPRFFRKAMSRFFRADWSFGLICKALS